MSLKCPNCFKYEDKYKLSRHMQTIQCLTFKTRAEEYFSSLEKEDKAKFLGKKKIREAYSDVIKENQRIKLSTIEVQKENESFKYTLRDLREKFDLVSRLIDRSNKLDVEKSINCLACLLILQKII